MFIVKLLFAMINLQLFAEGDHVTNTTGSAGLSAEMKTFYDKTLIHMASPYLLHDQFAQTRDIPKNGGKSIEFRLFAALPKALVPLTEGVTPPGKPMGTSTITATVSQYGDFVEQSDMLELTAVDNTIVEATKQLSQQAGLTLDAVTRNVLNAGTNVNFCSKVVDGALVEVTTRKTLDITSVLTVKEVKKAATKLKNRNAPKIDGYYVGFIHPNVASDLMEDKAWVEAHKYTTPENIFKGEIGRIAGVRFIESTECKIFNDDTCPANGADEYHSVYSTLILGADAYGVTKVEGGGLEHFVKQKGSGGTSDPLNQRSTVGWKATKTAERLVEDYIVRVESRCPDYDDEAAN